MLIGPKRGSSTVRVLDCTESYATIGSRDGAPRSISLANLEISFDNANGRLELQERYL